MKREIIWWLGAFALSTLMIGIATDFSFKTLDIQLHDTYYVFNSFGAVKWLTIIFIIGRNFHLLIEMLISKRVLFAFLVSLINPVGGLFVLLILNQLITLLKNLGVNPIQNGGTLLVVIILFLIFLYQIIVEVKAIKKLKAFFNKPLKTGNT